MNSSVNWTNPYADRDGTWMKGNLHTHALPASGCAKLSVEETIGLYENAGYDFISLSDHMNLTPVQSDKLVLIPGIEWNAPDPKAGRHTGLYSCNRDIVVAGTEIHDQTKMLAGLSGDDSLIILNHPDFEPTPHYTHEQLLAIEGYDGIEIFNGVIKRLPGYEISTYKWDYLLTQGKRVLGVASDDFHDHMDLCLGWNVVRAKSASPESIFSALKSGNFYASSGVTLTDIYRDGNRVTVESADGEEIQVIGHHGILFRTLHQPNATVNLDDLETSYVRFTVFGKGSSMAWTQPFFKEA